METFIIKKDGKRETFSIEKIKSAISKAFLSVGSFATQEILTQILSRLNITNCPNRCFGCHSPHLMEDKGEILDENTLTSLLEKYGNALTCICFMGGDGKPHEIQKLAQHIKLNPKYSLKTA